MPVKSEGGRWSNADEDRILLSGSDPDWPTRFAAEAELLRNVVPGDAVSDIIHIGSTAVPGLLAKPVIDLLLIPGRDYRRWAVVTALEGVGYIYWRDNPRPDRVFLVKGMPPFGRARTHHVHVRTPREARDMIKFRDQLIGNPKLAEEYGSLKRSLATRYASDREAYTRAKSDFVRTALQNAVPGRRHSP